MINIISSLKKHWLTPGHPGIEDKSDYSEQLCIHLQQLITLKR